ncbi:WEB family protein At3g02930, chloroplastic-like [Miscanthus floridulus]|uniref:WEB family protein At3g02930, chloroplastic-like n=1 Tax=Miscanthus floridulus TaxID=154761 RepID=UPI00345B43E7
MEGTRVTECSPSGLSEGSNHKQPSNSRATSVPRVGRLAKPASKPADRAPSPLHHAAGTPLDRSSASIDLQTPTTKPSPGGAAERRSFKASPASRGSTTDKQQPRAARTSELQAQLTLVQEDLRNAREHLASIENDRAQILEDLAVAKRLAADAHGKLEDSLLAQRRAEEALELERFKSTEREQSAIDLAQRTEDEWRRKYDSVRRRHAEDVASLIATARELEAVRDELAATAQAKDSALNQADELHGIANRSAKKAEVLTAEVARLKSRLDTELENKAKEAAETMERLESEASALRAELRKAKEFEEKLAKAEQAVEGLRVDVAYASRSEEDASRSAQEWRSKAESLETRIEAASQLSKRNEESLASLTNSFEDCTSMLQDKQSQLLQLEDKVVALEKEASEYKERFLETSRRLDVATEEACELHAAIDGLRSEHQLLHEAHQQAVSAEKTASAQVGHLTEDKNRLLKELADTREERDKMKKAVEDLAAALREVSSEAREAKDRVLAKQAELDDARPQMSELKAAMKNAEERYQLRLGSEAKISKDDWVSGFVDMLKRSDDGISSIQLEMNRLTESLRAAENEVQELRADKTELLSKLQEFEVQATNTEEQARAESSHLKDLLSSKDKELLALNHELTELRLRKSAALEKASEVSKLLGEMTARKNEEESTDKSKALQAKLEMDEVLESLKDAEGEAKAAKEEKVQLQSKLRLLESKITEANLTSEEAKISSLRLEEALEDKEHQLAGIVQENREMRAREAAAHVKIDELAVLLAEATARKGGESSNGAAAVTRSPEKQPSVLLKLICSPMHHNVRDDENNGEIIQNPKEDIKHVEVETVRQVKDEQKISVSAVDANSLENCKIIEDDLSKERDEDSESSDDDDVESPGDDALVDQMNGLLIHGPTSSFNQDQRIVQKKKRALLKKFGSLLKKKAHFTKLSSHSHS